MAKSNIPPTSGKVLDEVERRNALKLLNLHTIGELAEHHEISVLDLAHQLSLCAGDGHPAPRRQVSRKKAGEAAGSNAAVRAQLRRV